ncbi:hypothetical protein FRC15_005932 [Serendipita sp. 397]|nr:hypothetical protein FRC15_005932 [Serendipita sp. 397]
MQNYIIKAWLASVEFLITLLCIVTVQSGTAMSSPPDPGVRQSAAKRKRKSQKIVVDSDNESEDGHKQVNKSASRQNAFSPSKAMASLIVQEGKDDDYIADEDFLDEDIKMESPKKQPAQSKKSSAITRRKKKGPTESVGSSGSNKQTKVVIQSLEITEESQDSVTISETTVTTSNITSSYSGSMGDPWAADSRTPPTPSVSGTTEGGQKRKESGSALTEGRAGESGLPERPTKRQKLPSMRRNPNVGASGTNASESSTPTTKNAPGKVGMGLGRQIVDGPVTKDIDLRNEDVFASLFRKSGTGKGEASTSSERLEQKQAELNKLKEEYIAKKTREKAPPFDLGEQNRKLTEVQRLLASRNSRVCVNIVGSGLDTVNPGWRRMAEDQHSPAP